MTKGKMSKTKIQIGTAIAVLALVYIAALFTGCATKPGDPVDVQACETWRRAVAFYDALRATGTWVPSEDELKAEAAAKILMAVACGQAKLVTIQEGSKAGIGTIAWSRQPKKIRASGKWYYLKVPFSIFDTHGGSVYRPPLKDITIGPLYSTKGTDCLYSPDQGWLQRAVTGDPTMIPIGCR